MGHSGLITSESVQRRILELAETGESMRSIGRTVGVSKSTVSNVVKRGNVLPPREKTESADSYEKIFIGERKCDGCGRIVRVRECVVCRDRKVLNIKPD